MSRPDGLLEVGRIGRAHGITGELYVDLTSDREERLAVGSRLYTPSSEVVVEASKPSGGRWLVRFVGVADRNGAERLVGQLLFAEPIEDDDALWVHELIGARVVEAGGVDRGICVAVIDNPAHDLLELESGALVPVPFVVSFADGVITIDPPDGLFDES